MVTRTIMATWVQALYLSMNAWVLSWSLQAYIKASQNGEHALGTSLSFSDDGNTLAAGATSDESAATGINGDESDTSAYQAGALYIFVRSGSNWSQQAYIKASNTNAR